MAKHPTDAGHVAACAACQAREGLRGLDVDLDRVWFGVAAEVWARPVGPVETALGRLLGSPGLARALLTTPSLLLSWVLASAAVLAVGAWVTRTTGEPWVALLAPAVAGAGIAYAYGPGVDPAFELTQTMAISDRIVLLVRGLAVFGINAGLGLLASLVAAPARGVTLAWLIPMTAIAAFALAVATLTRSPGTGVSTALGVWMAIILARAAGTRDFASAAEPGPLILLYLVSTLGCIALVLLATGGTRKDAVRWL